MAMEFKTGKVIDIIFGVVLIWLSYLAFFKNLGSFSLRTWDESRIAVNTIEMFKSGNVLVTTYFDKPDLWNTKPPLLIWLQVFCIKVFGVSEWSLRIPSALSAALTVMLAYFFGAYGLKSKFLGMLASLMLLSAMGFSDIHAARTGDYDSLLTLWMTAGAMTVFLWIKHNNLKWLWLSALFLGVAVLTKSIVGLFFLPGIFGYIVLYKKNFILLCKRIENIGPVILWLFLVVGYYIGREMYLPGYLSAVWQNDLWGRYLIKQPEVSYPFLYYWNLMRTFRLQYWIYLWPVSIFGLLLPLDKKFKDYLVYSWFVILVFLVIISTSSTKQMWYELPIYPLVVLTASTLMVAIAKILPWWLKVIPILPVLFYLQRGIRTNLAYINRPDLDKNNIDCQKYGYIFSEVKRDWSGIVGLSGEDYCAPATFYFKLNNIQEIKYSDIKAGDTVLVCHRPTILKIKNKFKNVEEKLILDCVILSLVR